MKFIQSDAACCLELTRRNLTALLAKLDGHPPNSACTLIDPDNKIVVRAVEDEAHYTDRPPGELHSDTAQFIGHTTD